MLRAYAHVVPVLGLLLACQSAGRNIAMPQVQPPLAEMVVPAVFLTPRSQRYRIAVRPFVDATGLASGVTGPAAEVLVTALQSRDRFSLYDARELADGHPPSVSAAAPAEMAEPKTGAGAAPVNVYTELQGIVDGVLESHVTAFKADGRGNGHFEVDYRVVDPYSRMVVTSGSARIRLLAGAVVREDLAKMAGAVSLRFVDPELMAQHELAVSEVSLEGSEVMLTLDGGSQKQVQPGFVGFVVERDGHTHVERYLAKFVVVNVFPEASVGVVVEHCNAVGRCQSGEWVIPVEQAQNVHVGSRVRFK